LILEGSPRFIEEVCGVGEVTDVPDSATSPETNTWRLETDIPSTGEHSRVCKTADTGTYTRTTHCHRPCILPDSKA
jgi:hypothetical protein